MVRIAVAAALGISLYAGARAQDVSSEDKALVDTVRLAELKKDLHHHSEYFVYFAAVEILRIDPNGLGTLVAALKEEPRMSSRTSIISAIGKLGPRAGLALPAIARSLDAKYFSERKIAAWAIGEMGKAAESALPKLTKMLNEDDDSRVRRAVAKALGRIGRGREDVVAILLDAMVQDADISITCIKTLGEMGPAGRAAVPDLTKMLRRDRTSGIYAAEALGKIGPDSRQSVPALIKIMRESDRRADAALRRRIATALARIGTPVEDIVAILVQELGEPVASVDTSCAEALGMLGSPAAQALPQLKELAKEKSRQVRMAAALAIWQISNDAEFSVSLLMKEVRDLNRRERKEHVRMPDDRWFERAITILGEIGESAAEAVPALLECIDDKDPHVRTLVARSLGQIGPSAKSAIPRLEKLSSDPDPRVRQAAFEALISVRYRSATDVLNGKGREENQPEGGPDGSAE